MPTSLESLDSVLGLKRRRIDKLEAEAAAQARHVETCEAQRDDVLERKRQAEDHEQQVKDAMDALSTRATGFRPGDLVTLQHVLEMKVAETKAVARQLLAADKQLDAAREALRGTRQRIETSEQQVEQLRELRETLARELALAVEDAADEESEEAAVGRMVAGAHEARALDAESAWN